MGITYNLILESKKFKIKGFVKVPIAEKGTVIFLSERKGTNPLVTITEDENPQIKKMRNMNLGWQTVVDVSPHTVGVKIKAKASDRVSKFVVKLRADVRIISPEIIYRDWVEDLADYVKQDLKEFVEEIAREFDIQDELSLKRQISEQLEKGLQLEGIEVRVKKITIDCDMETQEYFKELVNTTRRKKLFIERQGAAGEIGKNLNGDTGALIDILEGRRPASDIVDVRRELRKNDINDVIEEITKKADLLNHLMENNTLSELEVQEAAKGLLPKLKGKDQKLLDEWEAETYAPYDEEENP